MVSSSVRPVETAPYPDSGARPTLSDLVALAFVAVAPFESYAKSLSGSAIKALGALLFVAWLLRLAVRRRWPRITHPALRSAVALLLVLLAATIAHQNGPAGTAVVIRYLSYIAALFVFADCLQDGLSADRVARVYVVSCTAAAVIGLGAFFRHDLRAIGPLSDPNDFAFFLVMAVPLGIALRREARRPRLYDVAIVVLILTILATLSRGATVGMVAMLVFAIVTRAVRVAAVVGAVALAATLAVGVAVVDSAKVDESVHAKSVVAQQNVDDRIERWEVAAEMTYDHPVLGIGPGGFEENYNRYIDFEIAKVGTVAPAHEMYLEVAAELGVAGLCAFVAMLGFGFRGARRVVRARGPDARLANAVCIALIGTGTAALFLTEQYYLPVWLLTALGVSLEAQAAALTAEQVT